jgi:hypothetical protein
VLSADANLHDARHENTIVDLTFCAGCTTAVAVPAISGQKAEACGCLAGSRSKVAFSAAAT